MKFFLSIIAKSLCIYLSIWLDPLMTLILLISSQVLSCAVDDVPRIFTMFSYATTGAVFADATPFVFLETLGIGMRIL